MDAYRSPLAAFAVAFCLGLAACSPLREFPPELPGSFAGIPLNGGRTQAISVSPTDTADVLLAMQFGGLWRTTDGGARWRHLRGLPAVFAADVQYGANGSTVVATVARDNQTANGAGIWVSRDGGSSWSRPATGAVPVTATSPARGSAHGIAVAPDEPRQWYVGTDHGVARSADDGATWEHVLVDPSLPVAGNRMQGAVSSVLAFPGGTVLAMTRSAIYRSDDRGASWRNVRNGDFSFYWGSVNMMDRSPYWSYAFILQNYGTLLFYELNSERWTTLPLPAGGGSRGPFVRVGKPSFSGGYTMIWVGQGVRTIFVTRKRVSSIRTIDAGDWSIIGRSAGIHDDTGDLGLDASLRPVMIGSDGGVFKPDEGDVRSWVSAAPNGSGMNSYQITDLAGNNITQESGTSTTLYYTTQDNGIWSSDDGGVTWPNNDCAEGFHLETRPIAAAADTITVAYGKIGCGPSGSMFSNAHLVNQRAVPDVDTAGNPLTNVGQAFYLKPGYWLRARMLPGNPPEILVSTDNGATWRKRFDVSLGFAGVPQRTKAHYPASYVKAYLPVFTGDNNPDGSQRIGLIRLFSLFQNRVGTFAESSVLALPADGSLGQRATEFDWQAVFGVHLKDWRFVIAPDIVNQDIKITRDGGRTWTTHAQLTAEVTRNGQYLLYDASQYRMQVTHIGFDPYRDERVLIGTRDAGIICSNDGGQSWGKIANSERILYVTGFQFQPDGTTLVSTYGRGLWKLRPRAVRCEPTRWPQPPLVVTTPDFDLDRWQGELDRIVEQPDAEEQTEPAGYDDPLVPRIVLSSEVASGGQVVVGDEQPLYVWGKGFDPALQAPLSATIDGAPLALESFRIERDGGFVARVTPPEDLAYGGHVLEVVQTTPEGPRRAAAEFVKAQLDEDLGEESEESVFRPENERPSDEGPLDPEEKQGQDQAPAQR